MRSRPIQVLVVDKAAVVLHAVGRCIADADNVQVAACLCDGKSTLSTLQSQWIDVIVLGNVPDMDMIDLLKQMRAIDHYVPILLFSTDTTTGHSRTLNALRHGASKSIKRPSHYTPGKLKECIENDLLTTIVSAFERTRFRRSKKPVSSELLKNAIAKAKGTHAIASETTSAAKPAKREHGVVVVGCSTGGVNALRTILPEFPRSFCRPVVVVQHILANFSSLLVDELSTKCKLDVCEAKDDESLRQGTIVIAQGGRHLTLEERHTSIRVRLNDAPPVNSCKPSTDVLFRSASQVYGSATTAVVLTGMGSDGTEGCRHVRERGGTVLVQDRETCVVWGMPRSVEEAGLSNEVVRLEEMSRRIIAASLAAELVAAK